MIELLGIGVAARGAWTVRRVCGRFEGRTFTVVLAPRRGERVAVLDVIAGRVIPAEGRAWIVGVPLEVGTAARIRARVGRVDLALRGAPDVAGPRWRTRLARLFDTGRPRVTGDALARVGLAPGAADRAADLDPWGRARLAVARALQGHPALLVVPEPDSHLSVHDVTSLLVLLRRLAARDGISVFVSLSDPRLAEESDTTLRIGDREAILA